MAVNHIGNAGGSAVSAGSYAATTLGHARWASAEGHPLEPVLKRENL